ASEPTATAAFAAPPVNQPAPLQPLPPAQQVYAPPPQQTAPPQYAAPMQPPAYPVPLRQSTPGLPTWLMAIVFAFAFLGIGVAAYWGLTRLRPQSGTPSASVESPAAKPGAKPHPLQKYIEISGVRILEDAKKKPMVKFMVINHSGAEITDLGGNVTVW